MDSMHKVSDASLYTDFGELSRLRAKASTDSDQAAKEVAKQFESLFLQMMLKSMREATVSGDSTESDQTRFYQDMFDKQISLDLTSRDDGRGIGLATMLEKQITGNNSVTSSQPDNIELIRNQINRSSSIHKTQGSEQE